MALILTADRALTDPIPDTPALQMTLISDGFSGGDAAIVIGRTTDSFAGGAPATWEGTTDSAGLSLEIVGGVAKRPSDADGTGSWTCGVPAPVADYEATFDLLAYPNTAAGFLDVRRTGVSGSASYRMNLSPSNAVTIQRRSGGTTTLTSLVGDDAPTPGETIGMGVFGDVVYVLRGGQVVWSVVDTAVTGAGYITFAGIGTTTDLAVDNFIVRSARRVTGA